MKKIEDVPKDIYNLLDDKTHHVPTKENLKAMVLDIAKQTKRALAEQEEDDGRGVLRPSSLGRKDCQLWYEGVQGRRPSFGGHKKLRFLFGHIVEAVLVFLAKESGHLVENEQKECVIDDVKGSMDLDLDKVRTDVKSTSTFSYNKFMSGGLVFDDPFGYLDQLSFYTEADGKEEGAFLVCDMQHGNLGVVKYDGLELNNAQCRIDRVKEVLKMKTRPPRAYSDEEKGKSGNRVLAKGCSWCPHKVPCWEDANGGRGLRAFKYSTGIEYFTHVEKEPSAKIEEVEVIDEFA